MRETSKSWELTRAVVMIASGTGLLLATACNKPSGEAKGDYPRASASAAGSSAPAPVAPILLESGLGDEDVRHFYRTPEGSEFLPLCLLDRMKQPNGEPFLDNPERFGLLTDTRSADDNPLKLPVGMTMDVPRDVEHLFKIRMLGFNCAACHVGEFSAGKTVRVMGAPSRFDVRRFFDEFGKSLEQFTLGDYASTALCVLREAICTPSSQKEKDAKSAVISAALKPESGDGEQGFNKKMRAILEPLIARPVPKMTDPMLHRPSFAELELSESKSIPKVASLLADSKGLPSALRAIPPERREALVQDAELDFEEVVRLIKARIAQAQKMTKMKPDQAGPGRVDAFMTAVNLMYDKDLSMDSPVSFPFIWGLDSHEWVHWDNNMNALVERNVGQALGLGAVFDEQRKSTVRMRNIHLLETIAEKMKAPAWPFGPLEKGLMDTGKRIYEDECEHCHSRPDDDPKTDLGTDKKRLTNFQQLVDNKPIPELLKAFTTAAKLEAYKAEEITPEEQKEMEKGRTPKFVSRDHYAPRPLAGIWAAAPYLHNNSVPTLEELLNPDSRPATFSFNGIEYDPEKVGLKVVRNPPNPAFDTTKPGNDNKGHEPSEKLRKDPKLRRALLEYLKSL